MMRSSSEYVPWACRNSLFAIVLTSEIQEDDWNRAKRLDVYSCQGACFSFSKVSAYGVTSNPSGKLLRISIVPSSLRHPTKGAKDSGEYGMKIVLFGVSDEKLSSDRIRSIGVAKSKIEVLLCEKADLVFSEEGPTYGKSPITAVSAASGNGSDVGSESSSATVGVISELVLNPDSECARKLMCL